MKYAYPDLSDIQFESLIVLLCQRLLGMSVQPFAKGPDGGRDAKFVGVANQIPSQSAPWNGTAIIQAKHTNGYNRSFSEIDFFNMNSENTIIGKEIPRIKKLKENGHLDHYMLFANRFLTGNKEEEIRSHLSKECNIPKQSILLYGLEMLELLLKTYSDIPKLADLDPVDSPLIVSPDELSEVVQALSIEKDNISQAFNDPPTPRMPYEEKNTLNNMTVDYAKEQRKRFLKDTRQIQVFLSAPENLDLLRAYENAVDEFQLKITAKRKDHQTFDEIMEHLADLLFARDAVLRQRQHKRLTRAVLFYMYWNCDIGKVNDAEAE